MNALLDSHVLLFIYGEADRLSTTARRTLDDPDTRLVASAVSIYEIVLKHRIGKLPGAARFVREWAAILHRDKVDLIDLTPEEADMAARFDIIHRDPFDRMIAAQAKTRSFVLLSADTALDGFGVSRLW